MGKSLVIVESPAKAKTINKYLGKDFKVMASMGHVRDLPKKELGVSVEDGFEPQYITLPTKKNIVSDLKSEAKKAEQIYLAPDPDREGEAICWHLQQAVIPKEKPVHRVLFNEITKKAVVEAIKNPIHVNMNLVDAQQARRILDRLVGYKISPILWQKVKRGISAGRVQSVALRMIVDRENEIRAFKSEEFWTFLALLEGVVPPSFKAKMVKWEEKNLRQGNKTAKLTIKDEATARSIEAEVKASDFIVQDIKRKGKTQNAAPPFTTSKLQQDASRALGFSVSKTMTLAQKLYEGIDIAGETFGLITYMRTDSTRVSEEALNQVRDYIGNNFAAPFLPEKPRFFKQNKGAQDGHEAIRPTRVDLTPEEVAPYLEKSSLRLYTLIWKRFVASQMAGKKMDETVLTIEAAKGIFEARGLVTTFEGFSILYSEKPSEGKSDDSGSGDLPKLTVGEKLKLHQFDTTQNFTKPPGRYTEASLVKALEENGIGRPSTYASIIATLQNRTYAEKRDGKFHPSDLGVLVTTLLVGAFPELMDISYTAKMENNLDQVERGEITWQGLLSNFYQGFQDNLQSAEEQMPNMKRTGLQTDLLCETCGAPTAIKNGKYGQFLSCTNYPECTYAKRLKDIDPESTNMFVLKSLIPTEEPSQKVEGINCAECGGDLVRKRSRYGEFLACGNFPDCRYIHQEKVDVPCPKCGGEIRVRKSKRGKVFYGCSQYPKCDYISWDRPLKEACPDCEAPQLFLKERKTGSQKYCANQDCKFKQDMDA